MPYRWLAAAALVIAAIFAVHRHGINYGAARVQQKADAERAKQETDLRRREAARSRNVQGVMDAQGKIAARARADADGARTELQRLRDAIAAADGAASTAGGTGDTRSPAELLGECAGEHQSVAGEADRLSVQVTGLHGWISAACTAQ